MPAKIYLTRRNLRTLLDKLDHKAKGGKTACTIIKRDNKHPKYPQTMRECYVVAVEDEDYYTHRAPGEVAPFWLQMAPGDSDGVQFAATDRDWLDWLKTLE